MAKTKSVKDVFDTWAQDYHAEGMEQSHWFSVKQAFTTISPSDGNYLEIGVGNGYGIHYMATHQFYRGTCYGLDISSHMVQRAREKTKNLTNVRLSAENFLEWKNPPDLRFALIFSMEVYYYFPDIQRGIDKAVSILDGSGVLMVLVNYYEENTISHTWPEELSTPMVLWNQEDYIKGFKKAGLQAVQQEIILPENTSRNLGTLLTRGVLSV